MPTSSWSDTPCFRCGWRARHGSTSRTSSRPPRRYGWSGSGLRRCPAGPGGGWERTFSCSSAIAAVSRWLVRWLRSEDVATCAGFRTAWCPTGVTGAADGSDWVCLPTSLRSACRASSHGMGTNGSAPAAAVDARLVLVGEGDASVSDLDPERVIAPDSSTAWCSRMPSRYWMRGWPVSADAPPGSVRSRSSTTGRVACRSSPPMWRRCSAVRGGARRAPRRRGRLH